MKLTTSMRNKLPASVFAGPGRSYPIVDRAHAKIAKVDAITSYARGNLSASMLAKIKAAANRKLRMGA